MTVGRKKSGPAGGLAAVLALSVVSLMLFTVYVKEGDCASGRGCGPLHTVQLGAAEVLRPVRALLSLAASPFDAAQDRVSSALSGEEQRLRRELSNTRALAAQASDLRRENERLRQMLEGQRPGYEYAPLARVIAPVGEQFTNRITINVGTEDGVRPQMPVIVGNNILVGRTTGQVSRHTAEVMLVTDHNFAAGVRIVPPAGFDPSSGQVDPAATGENVTYGEGILRTNIEGYFGVEYVDLSARAEEGDYVITSGRAGGRELLFPPGLFVGTIESVSSTDLDQYKKIVVEPAVDPDDLEEVRVITDW
ncbi:hypothetical protein Rxycam_00568 [Rubrobacter xylanophilus DSM 9941]|uniref:rod shape-determining protein MreC n=1 Tax=Rubrobacter xylanophilus TaxID=49319 RepID=UPI001C644790|nr:rod shape-determining protein MreC [Rubrobacter xylanophilus]QYJ14763.1 hypothetical protein Rxycam_00568 [Rubrobacter xylanophilus DSM 9941]